jgi:5-methylcytosine-specific restriction protein A
MGICEHISDPDTLGQSYRCTYPGKDVDHIINLASGGTDDLSNLQLLCDWHHKQKTAKEAAAKRKPRTERHPREQHPGLL